MSKQSKLESYTTYKTRFFTEPYISQVRNKSERINLSKLRTSCHKLLIETGRYDKTDKLNRICVHCNLKEIENEQHFLLSCTKYDSYRIPFLEMVHTMFPYVQRLDAQDKYIWIMSMEHEDLNNSLSNFVTLAFKKREEGT